MELQMHMLDAAILQMQSEIETEKSKIKSFMVDPTLIPLGEDEHANPAYKLHLMIHHLTENETALQTAMRLRNELNGE